MSQCRTSCLFPDTSRNLATPALVTDLLVTPSRANLLSPASFMIPASVIRVRSRSRSCSIGILAMCSKPASVTRVSDRYSRAINPAPRVSNLSPATAAELELVADDEYLEFQRRENEPGELPWVLDPEFL